MAPAPRPRRRGRPRRCRGCRLAPAAPRPKHGIHVRRSGPARAARSRPDAARPVVRPPAVAERASAWASSKTSRVFAQPTGPTNVARRCARTCLRRVPAWLSAPTSRYRDRACGTCASRARPSKSKASQPSAPGTTRSLRRSGVCLFAQSCSQSRAAGRRQDESARAVQRLALGYRRRLFTPPPRPHDPAPFC